MSSSATKLLMSIGLSLGLTGCYEIDKPIFPAANILPQTDAGMFSAEQDRFQGQQRFFWDTWGGELTDRWPNAEFMLQLMLDEPEVFGNQFESFGFINDPSDDFPVGFKRGMQDPTKTHETCAVCHVTELPDGKLWVGAPNAKIDFQRFEYEVNRRWIAAGNPSLMTDEREAKLLAYGPGRTNAEPNNYVTPIPTSFPAYYNLSQREYLNYNGTGTSTKVELSFAIFAFGPGQKAHGIPFPDNYIINNQLTEFMDNIEPPPVPPQNLDLIAQGQQVYQDAQCGSCHHIDNIGLDGIVQYDFEENSEELLPGEDPDWPNGSIKTSVARMDVLDQASLDPDGFVELIGFTIKRLLFPRMSDGFRIADLHGLWATAPYLHNGSVPTLRDLLNPADQRPEVFDLHGFSFDTTIYGNSNQGHEFGTELSNEDKDALVVYLNSL